MSTCPTLLMNRRYHHLKNNYREMQGLLAAVNHYANPVGMRITVSKTKVAPALIPDEQHQDVLLDCEPLEDVDKFKYVAQTSWRPTEDVGNHDQDRP